MLFSRLKLHWYKCLCCLLIFPAFLVTEKSKASEESMARPASEVEEGAPSEDKEGVPEGVMEEGTSDSNTGSETTSAMTEDAPPSEPAASEGPSRARPTAH